MKKVFTLLLLLAMVFLASCGATATEGSSPGLSGESSDANVIIMDAAYRTYPDAKSLLNEADRVFAGKITQIDFAVLDMRTGEAPIKSDPDASPALFSIYSIEINASYKGERQDSIKLFVDSGVPNYRMEEQIELLQDTFLAEAAREQKEVPVLRDMPTLAIGKTYLFVTKNATVEGYVFPMFPRQSIYDLDNPFELHHSDLTAQKVISSSGKENWDSFWGDWQRSHPGWEHQLDKDLVAQALAEVARG